MTEIVSEGERALRTLLRGHPEISEEVEALFAQALTAARAKEREECAKVAQAECVPCAGKIARAIRSRSQSTTEG